MNRIILLSLLCAFSIKASENVSNTEIKEPPMVTEHTITIRYYVSTGQYVTFRMPCVGITQMKSAITTAIALQQKTKKPAVHETNPNPLIIKYGPHLITDPKTSLNTMLGNKFNPKEDVLHVFKGDGSKNLILQR